MHGQGNSCNLSVSLTGICICETLCPGRGSAEMQNNTGWHDPCKCTGLHTCKNQPAWANCAYPECPAEQSAAGLGCHAELRAATIAARSAHIASFSGLMGRPDAIWLKQKHQASATPELLELQPSELPSPCLAGEPDASERQGAQCRCRCVLCSTMHVRLTTMPSRACKVL